MGKLGFFFVPVSRFTIHFSTFRRESSGTSRNS
jgi:hypothetical protein